MDLISEIIEEPNKLSNNFDTDSSSSSSSASQNIITIKCTKALFSKDGLKNNISSYILIIFITQFLLSILLFIKCGYHSLVNDIKNILEKKEKIKKINSVKNQIKTGSNNKNNKLFKKKKINFPPKKYNFKFINNKKYENNINNKKSNSNILLDPTKVNNNKIRKINKSNKKNEIINNKNNFNWRKNVVKKNLSSIMVQKEIKMTFNDYELNSLDYRDALSYDIRTCFQYYLSLFKVKNLILFSFCPLKDYNSQIIKLCIFSLSFSIYYAVNFAFFDDDMLHKIYELGGKYDFMYFIPKIAISFGISYVISTIIRIIFLSERNIIRIRMQPILSIAYDISNKEKRNLVIKYTIFFILGLIFLVFFWMLLSSFGAVYQNTQMFIFKNALISFAISLVYPIFIIIFPCIFRILSLNSETKNNVGMYKISKFLQIL